MPNSLRDKVIENFIQERLEICDDSNILSSREIQSEFNKWSEISCTPTKLTKVLLANGFKQRVKRIQVPGRSANRPSGVPQKVWIGLKMKGSQ